MPVPASPRERAVAALASTAVLLGLVMALVIGLAPPALGPRLAGTLVAVLVAPRPERREPQPPPRAAHRSPETGGAALHALATAVPAAAPPPVVIVPLPVPVATGSGAVASGADGQGGGAGGIGSGAGAGQGPGPGGSPADQPAVHARQIHGHLSPGDVPDGVLPPGGSAAVTVRYVVGVDGRVSGCTVTAASGTPQVAAIPCPLIEHRFRFRPARDTHGQPVPETIVETHTWFEPERRGRGGSAGAPSPPPAPVPYAP